MLSYLWSPLVALEVARHGHLDVVGALLIASAALAFAQGQALVGSLTFALSVGVKPLSIVLLPLFWRRISLRHAIAGVAMLLALYLPFWDRHRLPIGSVPAVIDRFRFNGPIFARVAELAGPWLATVLAVAAGLAVAVWARRRLSLATPEAWAWPMAVALLGAPLVYPWYLLWLVPFLVVPRTFPLAIWTISILITYVAWGQVGVSWGVPAWAMGVEYGALLGAVLWVWQRRRLGSAPPLSSPSASVP